MQIAKLLTGVDALLNAGRQSEVVKKPSILKDMIDRPEGYLLQAYIENDELMISIKKRKPVAALKGECDNGHETAR